MTTKAKEETKPKAAETAKKPVAEAPKVEEKKETVAEPIKPADEPKQPEKIDEPKKDLSPAVEPEQPKQPKDDELDIQDGKRLDQNVEASEFDKDEEEKLAHAKKPAVPEHVKHAIVNPNGAGVEWPRV
jgi:hypothetical protein